MPQRGPLTFEELFAVLKSTTDPLYLQSFLEQGYGTGLESFEAICEVLARVALAVDRTTQALYVQHWSGETSPPAGGAAPTQLRLQFTRSRRTDIPLTLLAGVVLYEEIATDWSRAGSLPVRTGRRYTLLNDFTFLPGESGPVLLDAVSFRPGFGYANPLLGTITGIQQPGTAFSNDEASVAQGAVSAQLVVVPEPDVVVPEHVGQYVELLGGANAGAVRLMYGYQGPDLIAPNGGTVTLAPIFVIRAFVAPVGTFQVGEVVEQLTGAVTTGTGRLRAFTATADGPPWYAVVELTSGSFAPTAGPLGPLVGQSSTATLIIVDFDTVAAFPATQLVNESGTAVWRVLDWATDLGLTVTNPEEAIPGDLAMLDTLGAERRVNRAPNEDDESYRKRVAEIADVVSPNAIRRIGNRIWARYGGSVCLREVGQELLPGLYFDGDDDFAAYSSCDLDGVSISGASLGRFVDGERVGQNNGGIWTLGRVTSTITAAVSPPVTPSPPAGATRVSAPPMPSLALLEIAGIWGPGFVPGVPIVGETSGATFLPGVVTGGLRVQDRFNLLLDYTEMRAFFLVGVPASDLGDFGVAYDAGPHNAFDASPYLAFFDGAPITAAQLNQATWQAINGARAAGVSFDLYAEDVGCR